MAKQWQIRRGTTAQNDAFTGALAEVTYDTEKKTVRIHDGTTTGGTELAKATDLYHPDLFDVKWSDHILDNISWLRADTFSWQSGTVYQVAYTHLVDEFRSPETYYAWTNFNEGDIIYTKSSTPSVGDNYYNSNTEVLGTITEIGVQMETITADGILYTRTASSDFTVGSLSSETVASITVQFYLADDGHKICPASEESNVAAIYNATGVAWYYIIDTDNHRFKLPRTKFGFTGIRSGVGGFVEAGLPNITGGFDTGDRRTHIGGTSGALYQTTVSSNQWSSMSELTGNTQGVGFDASKSNPIYGASDTVQPKATEMYLYFFVGNFETSSINNPVDVLNLIYPVGSIYIGIQTVCPMTTIMSGSIWELVSAGKALWTGNGSNANTTIEAGLPNITGSYDYPHLNDTTTSSHLTGAMYIKSVSGENRRIASEGGSSPGGFGFDASRSNSIYGNSTTVQPPAYVVNVWRRTA